MQSKFAKLNRAMAELVEDFNLVGFTLLAVEDKQRMVRHLVLILFVARNDCHAGERQPY